MFYYHNHAGKALKAGTRLPNVRHRLMSLNVFKRGSMVTVAAPAQSSWQCSKRDKALENSALDQASLGRNLEEAAQDLIQ